MRHFQEGGASISVKIRKARGDRLTRLTQYPPTSRPVLRYFFEHAAHFEIFQKLAEHLDQVKS